MYSVVIKTTPAGERTDGYEREVENYEIDQIASSPYIRKLVDLVGHYPADDPEKPDPQLRCEYLDATSSGDEESS